MPASLHGLSEDTIRPNNLDAPPLRGDLSPLSYPSTQRTQQVHRPVAVLLQQLQTELKHAICRELQPQLAADLVNRLRGTGTATQVANGNSRPATNDELMKRVSDKDVRDWYRAQGMNEREVNALRRSAFVSGLPNPSGTFLNNAIQYIVSPWIGSATTPWGSASVGLVAAAVGAPMNAAQQPAVVTVCESIRERGGPVIVPDKENINDKHWLPDLARMLQHQVREFSALHTELAKLVHDLGFSSHDAGLELKVKIDALPLTELMKLREQGQRLLNAERALHATQRNFMMTQGAHQRQWMGNRFQTAPRTLRAPVAAASSLVGKLAAVPTQHVLASAMAVAKRMFPYGPTAQTVAALAMTAVQHVAAGLDERAKQDCNNKLNLLYGDFFTEAGKAKLARGELLIAEDIDATKLAGFIRMPVQSIVKRVVSNLGRKIAELERSLASCGALPSVSDVASGSTSSALTGVANESDVLIHLKEDLARLKSGDLTSLHPGGWAEQLLTGTVKTIASEQLVKDVKMKYTARELSAQTAQRVGQMFHLAVFGSAASSVMGKLSSALSGGARNASIGQILGVGAASGVMAGIGAANQHTAITVKNHRREGEVDIGLRGQIRRGVMGAVDETLAQRTGTLASREMNQLLGEDSVDSILRFARELCLLVGDMRLPEEQPHRMTMGEAISQLHPGHVSPAGNLSVAIDIEEFHDHEPR